MISKPSSFAMDMATGAEFLATRQLESDPTRAKIARDIIIYIM